MTIRLPWSGPRVDPSVEFVSAIIPSCSTGCCDVYPGTVDHYVRLYSRSLTDAKLTAKICVRVFFSEACKILSSTWQLLTDRLRLRPYRLDDAASMFAVFGDPEVMRYSMSGADPSVEATQARIQKLMDHQASFGFSLWVVENRATGALLGDCGLKQLEEGPEIEVGYRFARSHWGSGYATEAAAASVRYGFGTLGLARIVAVVEPPNVASHHVLEKIGLHYQRQAHIYGRMMSYFAVDRAAFFEQHPDAPIADHLR